MPTVQGGTFIYAPCLTFQVDLMDRSLNIYISTGPYYVLLEEAHTPLKGMDTYVLCIRRSKGESESSRGDSQKIKGGR